MNSKLLIFSLVIVLLSILMLSVGQTARWGILDHVAMVDNYFNNGKLYPSKNSINLPGLSVYFPGMSLVGIILNYLSSNYLVQLMQIFSLSMIFVFYKIQWHIARELGFNLEKKIFYFISVISYFFLNFEWLVYAVECKPDIVAFNFGAIGIILFQSFERDKKKYFNFLVGIFFTGFAIVFKQQYVLFLMGLNIYGLFFGNKMFRIFALTSTLISIIILFYFWLNNSIWFWNVSVFTDDGLLSINQIITDHLLIGFYYLVFVFIAIILLYTNLLKFKTSTIVLNFQMLVRSSPWICILIMVALGGVVSAIKVGGNAGNTAFGLVILLPLCFAFIDYINLKVIYFLVIAVLIIRTPGIVKNGFSNYNDLEKLENFVKNDIKGNNLKILTGSNVYGCVRLIPELKIANNYWTYSFRDNSSQENELELVMGQQKYDYVIIENFSKNKEYLSSQKNYKIIFQNRLGIVAKFYL